MIPGAVVRCCGREYVWADEQLDDTDGEFVACPACGRDLTKLAESRR